jgi:hypothetical protein
MDIIRYDHAVHDRCPVVLGDRGNLLARLSNGLEGRTTSRPPTASEHSWLEARAAQLAAALAPGPYQRLVLICGKLLLLFQPARRWDTDTLRGLTVGYAAVVGDLPAWAVATAAGDLARGRIAQASLDFPPSSARLWSAAREEMVPLKAEQWRIECILKALPTR